MEQSKVSRSCRILLLRPLLGLLYDYRRGAEERELRDELAVS